MDIPPPPYSRHSSSTTATTSCTAFRLPTYAEVMSSPDWPASSCLPPYQSRTGQRHHPYMRILPVHRNYIPSQTMSFPDFYRSLQPPTDRNQPTASTRAPTPPPLPPVEELPADPEQRRKRLIRRVFLLVPECLAIVHAGLGAALRATDSRA